MNDTSEELSPGVNVLPEQTERPPAPAPEKDAAEVFTEALAAELLKEEPDPKALALLVVSGALRLGRHLVGSFDKIGTSLERLAGAHEDNADRMRDAEERIRSAGK